MPKESFFKNRIKSVGYALKGMFLLLQTEASIKIQFVIALVVTGAGFYFNISNTEWMIQLVAIGMVMGIEGLNTAVEKISDFIQPENDPKIGFIKDISAGAVMIVSILAGIVGLLIYVPKLV
ncbi:diacylglycerol kinase [Flagellimonas eckloniae]|uniref:Diacylglycerol kinase n=1 Tax=Flagellimonas eckloniae TaxID=346185 RepID=A0A0N8WFK5_9FLAO|nr:diacylglycerol kinase family protein [Allomuricauda eckloniae]KQC28955.1 diacylglycerol kinase [Allomuricauda eckloniae]